VTADGYFPIVYDITVVARVPAIFITAIVIAVIAIAVYHCACVVPIAPVAVFANFEAAVVKFTIVVPPVDVYDIAGVDYVAVVTLWLNWR